MTVGTGGFTALYASPEQIRGEPADPRDDVHALGVIWLQMLTGNLGKGRPSGSGWKTPLRTRGMSEAMLELLEQCMDDDPAMRPANAGELHAALRKLAGTTRATVSTPERVPSRESTAPKAPEPPQEWVNSIGMKLVRIPAGTFLMGSPDGEGEEDERPRHEVEITRPFCMSAFPVTQEEYQRVMGKNPSWFSAAGGGKDKLLSPDGVINTSHFPVERVSWEEAMQFCERLSRLAEEAREGRVYRLPTEAQWEYACRGGASSLSRYHFGNVLLATQANTVEHGPGRPCPVGSYPLNAFGLFDMHGNVQEWCLDCYDPTFYRDSVKQDPECRGDENRNVIRGGSWNSAGHRHHVEGEGPERCVIRGGSWNRDGDSCRSASRGRAAPNVRLHHLGFRVCCFLE
jgi:formylglycine-generating enzyme required for sulfatase activity